MVNIETQICAKLIDERTRDIVKEICYKLVQSQFIIVPL